MRATLDYEGSIMNNFFQIRKTSGWFGVIMVICVLSISGCFPQSVPLAILPMAEPEAAALNMKGIDQYQVGEWNAALELFESAIQVNPLLVEAHFNAALTLHKLDRHQEATLYFERAGALAPDNRSIIDSTLYRNHLGLSSTLEQHMSGGYRYRSDK
jgi:tetratricopeptide (TPR) repeat protein